jgi:hypothetical protein
VQQAVKYLYTEGANLEHADSDGLSALAHATAGGHALVVRFLLERQPSLVTMTDLYCRPVTDLAVKDEIKECYKKVPFPTDAYVTQCIDKLHGMLKSIKVTGAFQGAEFDTNDGAVELIRKTLADSKNVSHHQRIASFLAGSLARPMTEFRNVMPAEGKVNALRAKIAASDKEEGMEAACDNLRDRGRLVMYLTDRWTRNVRVTRNMPIKADKEVISVIQEMVEGYKKQIAQWEEEKSNLANVSGIFDHSFGEMECHSRIFPLTGTRRVDHGNLASRNRRCSAQDPICAFVRQRAPSGFVEPLRKACERAVGQVPKIIRRFHHEGELESDQLCFIEF